MIGVGGVGGDVGLQQLSHPEDTTKGPFKVPDTVHHHAFCIPYQLLQHLQELGVRNKMPLIIEQQLPDVLEGHPVVVCHLKKGNRDISETT